MRKSFLAFVAIAAMFFLSNTTAKASTTEIFLLSGNASLASSFSAVVSGSPGALAAGSLNGWSYVIADDSNSPSGLPYGIESYTFEASCVSGGCLTAPLRMFVSSVDFDSVPGLFTSLSVVGEPISGSTSQASFFNTDNLYFGLWATPPASAPYGDPTGTYFGTPISVSGGAGSSEGYYTAPVSGPFSLTLEDTFISGGSTSPFNAVTGEIGAAPEPRTLLLFGAGLFLIGAFVRRQLHA